MPASAGGARRFQLLPCPQVMGIFLENFKGRAVGDRFLRETALRELQIAMREEAEIGGRPARQAGRRLDGLFGAFTEGLGYRNVELQPVFQNDTNRLAEFRRAGYLAQIGSHA